MKNIWLIKIMSSDAYVNALVMMIYENCLSKRKRLYAKSECIEVQNLLAIYTARNDIKSLEELAAYYEGVPSVIELSIKYGMR